MRRISRGFTLVELLVVIGIISVLAALLLPSIDQSFYQARLTSCANNLHQMGIGLIQYTGDYRGAYPYHVCNVTGIGTRYGLMIYGHDERPMYRPYFPIDLFVCPLSLTPPGIDTHIAATEVIGSYDLWFGAPIRNGVPESGMMRVGDTPKYAGREFSILAADAERTVPDQWDTSSHPDKDGALVSYSRKDSSYFFGQWYGYPPVAGSQYRGVIDRNFLQQDGSVYRINDIERVHDPRMEQLPDWAMAYSFLPWKQ